MLPPPMARRSTPRAARASARVAIAPGSFFSWTTNWLAMSVTTSEGDWEPDFTRATSTDDDRMADARVPR